MGGVSVNDCPSDISAEEARNNLSKKVKDLRDPRNLPALGGALNYAQAAGQYAKANKPSTYELVLELLSFDNSRNLQLFVDKVLFTIDSLLNFEIGKVQQVHSISFILYRERK